MLGDERFEVEVPSTAVMDMSGVSASTSVSIVVVAPADNSPQTLRVEALSLSNSPTTSLSLASLNLTFDEDIQFEETLTVDLCTNSGAGFGDVSAHAGSADGSFAVHLVTSESVSWSTLGVRLDQKLHPNQIANILIDTRAVLESSGKPFVGLAGSDFKFAVVEQVVVPNGAGTFPADETSTTTTIVVLFVGPVQLAGGNASFRVALWSGAEVLGGKNIMIQRGLQIGHHDCPNAIGQVEGMPEGEPWRHCGDQLSLGRYSKGEVFTNNRLGQGARAGQNSKVRFGVAFRTDWYGSSTDNFLPVAQHGNEDGWSRRHRDSIVSRHRC